VLKQYSLSFSFPNDRNKKDNVGGFAGTFEQKRDYLDCLTETSGENYPDETVKS
jgi:hypothetical protein